MDSSALTLKKLSEQVLKADGSMPLELLLVHLAPVERLREAAQRLGLSPKPNELGSNLIHEENQALSLGFEHMKEGSFKCTKERSHYVYF